MSNNNRIGLLMTAALFALSVSVVPALAAGDPEPRSAPSVNKGVSGGSSTSKQKKKNVDRHSQEQNRDYIGAYKAARALVLDGKYQEGLQAFLALGHDDDAEVANYVGYTYRKLRNYPLSKVWYERALAADPDHVRTWEYYGLWHLEQGNEPKAREFLEKVRVLCGNTTCQEYVDLRDAIENGLESY
jgi:tetratricopeptide (TPR) repeat protein